MTNISGIFGWIVSFIITCLAAAVFPYRRKDLYQTSPMRGRIGGVPWIAVVGILGIVTLLFAEYSFWVDPIVGVKVLPWMKFVLPAVFVSGFVWYLAATSLQRQRGVDVKRTFAEIPPE